MRFAILILTTLAFGALADEAPQLKATELLGMQVRDAASGAEGRIEDLVVDIANSRVHYVVIDMAARQAAVPIALLSIGIPSEPAILERRAQGPVEPRAGMALARASTLIGWEFENEPGVDQGVITDLAVDPRTGAVAYALVRLHKVPGHLHRLELASFRMSPLRENLVLTEPPTAAAAGGTAQEARKP